MIVATDHAAARVSFTVPASSGSYAPERITLSPVNRSGSGLLGVQALVEATVAASTVELWMLRHGGDLLTDADYFLSSNTLSGASAASAFWPMISWPAVQLRAKSGGTSGSLIVNATGD